MTALGVSTLSTVMANSITTRIMSLKLRTVLRKQFTFEGVLGSIIGKCSDGQLAVNLQSCVGRMNSDICFCADAFIIIL